jgi:NADPH:quinone reductase-like Zn-dependent oxidoreductase
MIPQISIHYYLFWCHFDRTLGQSSWVQIWLKATYVPPQGSEVVIRNNTIGITSLDVKIQHVDFIKMRYLGVLGCEIAGEVIAVGYLVERLRVESIASVQAEK